MMQAKILKTNAWHIISVPALTSDHVNKKWHTVFFKMAGLGGQAELIVKSKFLD